MTSLVFWPFLTYPPTYLVLLYNVPFLGLSCTPLPTLQWDVINERSLGHYFDTFSWGDYLKFFKIAILKLADRMRSMRTNGASKNQACTVLLIETKKG